MLVAGVEIKQDLYYKDLLEIYICSAELRKIETRWKLRKPGFFSFFSQYFTLKKELNWYKAKMVGVLTKAKNPKKHIKHLEEFISYHNLLNKTKESKQHADPTEAINNICSYLAVRLKKTPKRILEEVSAGETERIITELAKYEVSKVSNLLRAQHDPKSLSKDLQREIRRLRKPTKEELESGKVVEIHRGKSLNARIPIGPN